MTKRSNNFMQGLEKNICSLKDTLSDFRAHKIDKSKLLLIIKIQKQHLKLIRLILSIETSPGEVKKAMVKSGFIEDEQYDVKQLKAHIKLSRALIKEIEVELQGEKKGKEVKNGRIKI